MHFTMELRANAAPKDRQTQQNCDLDASDRGAMQQCVRGEGGPWLKQHCIAQLHPRQIQVARVLGTSPFIKNSIAQPLWMT